MVTKKDGTTTEDNAVLRALGLRAEINVIIPIVVFIVVLFGYALISRRLERTLITAPMFFTVAGMVMFPLLPDMLEVGFNANIFLRLAEIGLVMLLFTDASRADFGCCAASRTCRYVC